MRKINKMITNNELKRLFPVSDDTFSQWWDGKKVSSDTDNICIIAGMVQADVDYANNCNDDTEMVKLLAITALEYSKSGLLHLSAYAEKLIQTIQGIKFN